MKLKDLKDNDKRLYKYCEEKQHCLDMLEALDEDLAVDRYQDTQPGGGNCADENRCSCEAYSDKLSKLTSEYVFGELYQQANIVDKKLLDRVLEVFENNYIRTIYSEFNPAVQMQAFMDCIFQLPFAEKEFSAEDIQLITEGGEHFVSLVKEAYDEAWDADLDDFRCDPILPGMKEAEKFLKDKGLLKESSLDSRIEGAKYKQGNISGFTPGLSVRKNDRGIE